VAEDRIRPREDPDPIAEALHRLHRAGWSVGDAASRDKAGWRIWIVSGHNGENLIWAVGATAAQAWGGAVDQARGLGMLGA
jgi:hypothetical protein